MSKQIISKQEVIDLLNNTKNEKNESYIKHYINKILAMNDDEFQQELNSNNVSTMEQVKDFFRNKIDEAFADRKQSKEDEYLSTASWGKSKPTYETKQFLIALLIKERINGKKLTIIDAGAGLGRNSIYLAENGFNVIAVEYDEGAIAPLKNNIRDNDQSDNIQVVNSNILDFLRQQENHSIDALLDSGMSHYLTIQEKEEYFNLLRQKMTEDGLFSITHFSKEDDSAIGLSEEELKKLLGKMTELDEIHYNTWIDSISQDKHFAYKGLLAMPKGRSDEIKKSYKEIFALISEKKLDNIEHVRKYLDKQTKDESRQEENYMQNSKISIQRLGEETLEEQKDTIFLDEIENEQARQEITIAEQRDTQENTLNR